jgi:hypothetical protein
MRVLNAIVEKGYNVREHDRMVSLNNVRLEITQHSMKSIQVLTYVSFNLCVRAVREFFYLVSVVMVVNIHRQELIQVRLERKTLPGIKG